jgi:4-hydroxy-tetrahydrodipicolinate synthase
MSQRTQWSGVFTPVVTPFTAKGDVDPTLFTRQVDLLIDEGVDGIIVAGTTGEFYSMDMTEKVELFALAKEAIRGRVPVLAGTACIGTRDTLKLTAKAQELGLQGSLMLPPAFCMPTPREIVQFYREVSALQFPLMVYNNPARTGVNLGAPIAAELAKLDSVVAFKETQKDIYAFTETMRLVRDSMAIFSGLEPYATAQFSRGAVGVVSTISNVCATDVVELTKALSAGDFRAAEVAQHRIDKLYLLMVNSGLSNFAYVKAAMQILGRPGGLPRAPHLPGDASAMAIIEQGLREIYPERFQ